MLEIIGEFAWSLRRDGLAVSPPQVIDMARATALVGLGDRDRLRAALACIVAGSRDERARFDESFDRFFDVGTPAHRDPYAKLRDRGFDENTIAFLRDALAVGAAAGDAGSRALQAWLGGGAELSHLLGGPIDRAVLAIHHPAQVGPLVQEVLDRGAFYRASDKLALLRLELVGALGEIGARLADALAAELDRARRDLRPHLQERVARAHGAAAARDPAELLAPFARLSPEEIARLRAAVRALGERLRGAARVREKRRTAGRLDAPRTVRRALATSGVPFQPVRHRKRRAAPHLVLLCDVSDSVRAASGLMLELLHALHELFEKTRSFVFVREVEEVTALFESARGESALDRLQHERPFSTGDVSSYARAFRLFDEKFRSGLASRATLVILADGRTNYLPDGAAWLRRWRSRFARVVWLCPEPRAAWSIGDSAMTKFAAEADLVLPLTSLDDFERAARRLAAGA